MSAPQSETVADATEIIYETVGGEVHRTTFEPWDGPDATHERVEYQWTGCSWRRMGSELVELIAAPTETGA